MKAASTQWAMVCGMDLEWRLRAGLRLMTLTGGKRFCESTPAEARENLRQQYGSPAADLIHGRPIALPAVEDVEFEGPAGSLKARIYRPDVDGSAPGVVFFHGGAWVVGDLDIYDRVCRRLAAKSGRVVCSVDYRLAPEHRFPAAWDDAFAAVEWVARNGDDFAIDTERIAVAGESAGGTLAAATCQQARDAGGPAIDRQVLVYPKTDWSQTYASVVELADAPIINKNDLEWSSQHVFSDEEECLDPRASPLLGDVEDLPRALLVTAEFDPLQDEVEAYATALREAGNEVVYRCYPRQPHGFLVLGRLASRAGAVQSDIAAFLSS